MLVVGAGSIGKRHIRNLLDLGVEVSACRQRSTLRAELAAEFGIPVFDSLESGLAQGQDAVVVCNRTDQHLGTALAAASRGCHLYIEKPVADSLAGLTELQHLAQARRLVVEVGCMLRFHPNLQTVRELLAQRSIGDLYYARVWVGQDLAEWRPATDYRDSYSARRDHGGGVVLDLIHELDYLMWWFGSVRRVSAFVGHRSALQTDTEDVAQILLEFHGGLLASVHLDCVRPSFARAAEIVGSDGVISWDYATARVAVRRRGGHAAESFDAPAGFARNTMFVDHMRHFLARIDDGGAPAVDLEDGARALRVALAARASSGCGAVLCPDDIAE